MGTALDRTQIFFARHGGSTIFLARFIPGLRVWAAMPVMPRPQIRFPYFSIPGSLRTALIRSAPSRYSIGVFSPRST